MPPLADNRDLGLLDSIGSLDLKRTLTPRLLELIDEVEYLEDNKFEFENRVVYITIHHRLYE